MNRWREYLDRMASAAAKSALRAIFKVADHYGVSRAGWIAALLNAEDPGSWIVVRFSEKDPTHLAVVPCTVTRAGLLGATETLFELLAEHEHENGIVAAEAKPRTVH